MSLVTLLLAFVATLAGGAQGVAPSQQVGVTVTFLANEGVLLAAGESSVLIDGLFQFYGEGFAVPADSTQRALATARAPFDRVNVVLVTHRHGDHFQPSSVASHLAANPRASFATSRQVIDSLLEVSQARTLAASRLLSRTMRTGERRREVVNGVPIEFLGIPHGGGLRNRLFVEHLGFIVELGGRRVLHIGDTGTDVDVYEKLRLDTLRIDVALVPDWMVTSKDGSEIIRRWIRPRQVVAIHVGAGRGSSAESAVRSAHPGAIAFVRSLETHRW
jgi:L-ascorbate metabolism protein UlaG (beta-lactamase superfamily)